MSRTTAGRHAQRPGLDQDRKKVSRLWANAKRASVQAYSPCSLPGGYRGWPPRSYVLGPGQGEHLILRGGNIFIRANPGRASNSIAMGTEQVPVGVGIPAHRHFQMDEAFYVVDGRGFCILDDARHPIEKGGSIFIPKNTWHAFENADCDCSCSGLWRLLGWRRFFVK